MNRREFLLKAALTSSGLYLFGCGREESGSGFLTRGAVGERGKITLYDMNAQALYMDGTFGPYTGVIKVDYIVNNQPVVLKFWHGHGGRDHMFTLQPSHYDELKKLKRVYIETTVVDSHTHKLFIDPVDPKWRVKGAQPVSIDVPDTRIA